MKWYLTYVLAVFTINLHSQINTGTVKDSIGNPIENAYVLNIGSNTHAHTNELGVFIIDKTSKNDELVVTSLGFKKLNFRVAESEITIILEEDVYKLDQVVIQPKMSAMNVISKIDLSTNPVNSSQEILRKVPGLFIGQHAGGGKAEQIFLRGFDIDHGTDIAVSVDGIPVNMVSHAHGQGYADLHFVIPETVEKIDFGKGTYYANKGDFATAGYVSFHTKEKFDDSAISFEYGQFNTLRTVGIFNLLEKGKTQNAFVATEYILTDGPFDSPQNFKRINLFGKYTGVFADNSKFSLQVSRFASKWNASGQIPQRLVDSGAISRFGAVDDTEGGNTSRTNVNFAIVKPISETAFLKANAYYSHYDFELYSNFTFFLNDPDNGDQIRQKEKRNIYGFNAELYAKTSTGLFQFGIGLRSDDTNNTELSHTTGRYTTLEVIKLGDINQSNMFSYVNTEFDFGKLKINPAIRVDYFKFNYENKLTTTFQSQTEDKIKISPKLNFIYSQNNNFQLYLKSGLGFHSNDTRVVVEQTGKKIVPTAFGSDFGTIFKPLPKMVITAALWYLYLQQEFVYVGDAGIVEPSGKTKRMGVDFGLRYQLNKWLFFDTDLNYTYARSIDEPSGQDYIPLAPDFTSTGGFSFRNLKRFSGGIRYRYLKSRAANEDNSIIAKGYFLSDLNVNYDYRDFTFGLTVENIFNTDWNETQFATESRLQNESQSVTEIHFTPGVPIFIKCKAIYKF
ncbi:MAG: TonB-dependent receptor plug domain-containing protein [Bacteroidota bacterium]